MNEHSDTPPDRNQQRMKIIGLGESSIRKSYYPELQQKISELEKTNLDLLDAIEEIQCKEQELRSNYRELQATQSALEMARKKLSLLNILTFQDIQSALFSLHGYLTLTSEFITGDTEKDYLARSMEQMQKIDRALYVAKQYQNMGIHPPKWQNVMEIFVYAVSHLNLSNLKRDIHLEGIEIFADPLLEDAFTYLLENIPIHGGPVSWYRFSYAENNSTLSLILEDNGTGIEDKHKSQIFMREFGESKGEGLFLVREILSITGITITENGVFGEGARFEMVIPESMYRITRS